MKKVIVTRHATTPWNREKRKQGWTDTELDDDGREEARALATKLVGQGIEKIIASDLKRAFETATIIGEVLGLEVLRDNRLRECSFGRLEGKTREEITSYEDSMRESWNDEYYSYDFSAYGGENQGMVLSRHTNFIDELKRSPEDVILVVGHGRGLNTLLAFLKSTPDLKRGEFRILFIQ